jgi:hypothetical protein
MSCALCRASACFTIAVLPTRFGIEAQRLLRARYPIGPSHRKSSEIATRSWIKETRTKRGLTAASDLACTAWGLARGLSRSSASAARAIGL